MATRRDCQEIPLPQMIREARDTYRRAVGVALEDAGCDDIPGNGAFVLAGMDHRTPDPVFRPQADVVAALGLSKQAASQLIDALVLRGYVERRNDPVDRRRMEVRLTNRGRSAASAIHTTVAAIEAELVQLISLDELQGLRAGLAAYRVLGARQRERR